MKQITPQCSLVAKNMSSPASRIQLSKKTLIPHTPRHSASINSVVFSLDGLSVITGSSDDTIRLFSIQGEELALLEGHLGAISDLALHPSGEYLASASEDGSVRIWNLKNFSAEFSLLEAKKAVTAVVFTPDGRLIAGGKDRFVRIYDIAKKVVIGELQCSPVTCLAVDSEGKILLIGTTTNIEVVDLTTFQKTHELFGHTLPVQYLDFSPASKPKHPLLLSCSIDESVKMWDALTFEIINEIKPHSGAVMAVAFSPTGTQFCTGSYDRSIAIFDVNSPKATKRFRGPELAVNDIAWSPDGNLIAYVSADGSLRIISLVEDKMILNLERNDQAITAIVHSQDQSSIYLGLEDGNVLHVTLEGDLLRKSGPLHDGAITWLDQTIIGERTVLVTSGTDKLVRLWNPDDWSMISEARGHKGTVRKFLILPEKRTLFSCSVDGSVNQYNLGANFGGEPEHQGDNNSGGKVPEQTPIDSPTVLPLLTSLKLWKHSVNTIAISHDKRFLAVGSNDATITLIDTSSLVSKMSIKGHKNHVMSVLFSLEDKRIYSGGRNGDLIIFDAMSGAILDTLSFHTDSLHSILEAPAHHVAFVTISNDNSVILFSNDEIVGQVFFAANVNSAMWGNPETIEFFVSTSIGELFLISAEEPE